MTAARRAALAAGLGATVGAPLHAQLRAGARPYVDASVGIGENRLDCGRDCTVAGPAAFARINRAWGDVTLDPYAPVFRVGLGYSVGSGHLRFAPRLDVLRTYRSHGVAYYAAEIGLGLRWQQ